jgi:NAD(P)-dependent dehydrogenase (short-subunit alcohol dehydrogenase family)
LVTLNRANLFSIEGRTAVLTGASGFLGRAMARTLLENGARVVAIGRSARLDALAGEWRREFGVDAVRAVRVDMNDLDALSRALEEIAAVEERIDVLVNNAHELGPATGFNVPDSGVEGATYEQWMRNLTGGVYWAALTVQKLGLRMKAAGAGSIVNVSTMYALVAPSPHLYEGTSFMNPAGYSAAKAGLLAFTRYVASFWGPHNVRSNAILPGPFSNTEDAGPNSVQNPVFIERLKARTALGRLGGAADLAGAFTASSWTAAGPSRNPGEFMAQAVRIGSKNVGEGEPCYVVAEIGINHNGDLELAKRLIDAAVLAGCDAVKFQKRTVEIVYSAEELSRPRESPFGSTNGDLKRGLEFGLDEYVAIDRYCRERSIAWFASCWDEASVDFMERFDPPCYKIASASLTDDGLLRHHRATRRPVVLSTGMSTIDQVDQHVSIGAQRSQPSRHREPGRTIRCPGRLLRA